MPENLDPALTRAGRVDLVLKYSLASSEQAKQLFEVFYRPTQTENIDDGIDLEQKSSDGRVGTESKGHPFELPADISSEQISNWAIEFGGCVPADTFSIADLQGFLLQKKKEPELAARSIKDWVAAELAKKKEAAEKKAKEEEEAQVAKEAEKAQKEKDESKSAQKAEKKSAPPADHPVDAARTAMAARLIQAMQSQPVDVEG